MRKYQKGVIILMALSIQFANKLTIMTLKLKLKLVHLQCIYNIFHIIQFNMTTLLTSSLKIGKIHGFVLNSKII